jgi:hypothetical protein
MGNHPMKAPHRFQSGFVANRIARFERMRLGDDSIKMAAFGSGATMHPGGVWTGKSVDFYVQRDGKDGPEYWVSHDDGFTACAELTGALPQPPLAKQYEGR